MLLLKLPLLLSDAICMRITATPPNGPVCPKDIIIPDWREHFLRSLAWPSACLRFITWFAVVAEMLVILASQNPSNTISKMILTALMLNGRHVCKIHISSLSILGSTLVAVGTYTRIRCYHTLGRMFTFELCLRDDHQLIMDGPYAVLRHPSYAGLIMTIIGACCSHASGSWVGECGVKEYTLGRVLMLYWMVVAGSVIASLVLRIPREEEILRRRFGEQWENWAQEVRYRLVPGVY
ncbi:hypothetical protein AMATHDRAFT_147544 [Amanita thiersii Skay4041]|uniref:Protein-S-isoprenylcysteine O-methyltransferase n=1 Tax=Amanita thiersii Skay4041 TaxID=703135 RepID=A0A2A9NME5_9AGAR|nr:hypothetical protein AMATHDRAFT_147544 [Amanita thiersii Skay4041]